MTSPSDPPPEAPEPTDWSALLGDQVALNAERYFRLAVGLVKDPAVAEDVCQAAFLKAWQQRDRLRDAAALHGWLTRVVVNEGFQVLRRRKTEKRAIDERIAPREREKGSLGQADSAALKESIVLALAQVPEQTRLVLVMRLMQGYSGNETKEMLGCSASEVSRRLHEGMERLRPLLADWGPLVGR